MMLHQRLWSGCPHDPSRSCPFDSSLVSSAVVVLVLLAFETKWYFWYSFSSGVLWSRFSSFVDCSASEDLGFGTFQGAKYKNLEAKYTSETGTSLVEKICRTVNSSVHKCQYYHDHLTKIENNELKWNHGDYPFFISFNPSAICLPTLDPPRKFPWVMRNITCLVLKSWFLPWAKIL